MAELWELVNELGEGSGVIYNRESGEPFPEGLYFRVVEVWVKVSDKLLITQRHPNKWRGLSWEVPGGGVILGEVPRESAARELFEETGISALPEELSLLGTSFHGAAMIYSYYLELRGQPNLTLQPTEVVDYKYLTLPEATLVSELTPGTKIRLETYWNILKEKFEKT
ncbi:MAG: NUDIX hydrolase [Clostridia bacterium]|nr:NUDIX hydrolase [Clostridia bacterium]